MAETLWRNSRQTLMADAGSADELMHFQRNSKLSGCVAMGGCICGWQRRRVCDARCVCLLLPWCGSCWAVKTENWWLVGVSILESDRIWFGCEA